MSYSISLENFASLENPWRQLLSDCIVNHVFLTPPWQRAWWRAFGSDSEMLLLAARQDGRLGGIAPLRRNGGGIYFIGSSDVCDYMDFIALRGEESAIFTQFLDYLANIDWNRIELHSLLPRSLALEYFIPFARQKGYLVEITQEDVSPELILPPSWDEYLARLATKDRHEIRRKMRRLERTGLPHFYTITGGEQVAQTMPDFFRMFELSAGEKADFMTAPRRVFFETLAGSLSEAGYFRLFCLEMDGKRVSYVICFDYENELYLYNSAYDPAAASTNVGLMLKLHCLKQGILEGKRRFDFLRGNERYKYELGGQDVPVYHCVITKV
jgi:CelD/BcsL family acetyltransferase involved in cellulose biosynthesis